MAQENNKQSGLSWSSPATPATPVAPASPKPASAAGPVVYMQQTQAPIYAGLLVGGIIVGVLIASAWSAVNKNGPGSTTATSTQSTSTGGSAASSTGLKGSAVGAPLQVADQAAGTNVTISRLDISKPTWVVVYVSREGQPSNALGARLFFPGDHEGQVALLRATQAGQNYFVGLSVDDGDKVFSLSKDKPLADADGGPLWATFSAR